VLFGPNLFEENALVTVTAVFFNFFFVKIKQNLGNYLMYLCKQKSEKI